MKGGYSVIGDGRWWGREETVSKDRIRDRIGNGGDVLFDVSVMCAKEESGLQEDMKQTHLGGCWLVELHIGG